jgi:hypothetical protein
MDVLIRLRCAELDRSSAAAIAMIGINNQACIHSIPPDTRRLARRVPGSTSWREPYNSPAVLPIPQPTARCFLVGESR